MLTVTNECNVDSGSPILCDSSLIFKYGGRELAENVDQLQITLDEGPGRYLVTTSVNGWGGLEETQGEIDFPSGVAMLGDPCYAIDEQWDKFLDDTDYCRDLGTHGVNIDTCGDGCFKVTCTFSKVKGLTNETK